MLCKITAWVLAMILVGLKILTLLWRCSGMFQQLKKLKEMKDRGLNNLPWSSHNPYRLSHGIPWLLIVARHPLLLPRLPKL